MRVVSLFRKTMIENIRDWKILILTLSFAPFFVALMYFYTAESTTTYRIVVVNHDEGEMGQGLIAAITDIRSPDAGVILEVQEEKDIDRALERLEHRRADVVVEIPNRFSGVLRDYRQETRTPPAVVSTYGDATNVRYMMAAAYADYLIYEFGAAMTGEQGPLRLEAQTIGQVTSLNAFELYVPALLALSLMMLMFTAAASLIKEKDKGTLVRLRVSNMTTFEWLSAVSASQLIIGLLALGLTFLTAIALGYRSSGSLLAVTVVGLMSCMAIVAISVLVAAYTRTIFDLVTIGCFPFFILMFFSGGMFPLPDVSLFAVGGRAVNLNEVLPTTHTITAFSKILHSGSGLVEVVPELGAIAALTVTFFAVGTWLFTRRHMRAV